MRKIVLVYGLIAGLICAAVLGISSVLGSGSISYEYGMYFGFTSMILAAVVMWFGIAQHKKNLGGRISFGRAFKTGFLMTLIASTMYVATWMITGPENFGETYSGYEVQNMRKNGISEKEIAAHVEGNREMWEKYDSNPAYRAALTYVEIVPVHLIIVLIASVVLSWKKKEVAV